MVKTRAAWKVLDQVESHQKHQSVEPSRLKVFQTKGIFTKLEMRCKGTQLRILKGLLSIATGCGSHLFGGSSS